MRKQFPNANTQSVINVPDFFFLLFFHTRAPRFPPSRLRALGMFPASRARWKQDPRRRGLAQLATLNTTDQTRRDETRRGRRRGTVQIAARPQPVARSLSRLFSIPGMEPKPGPDPPLVS